MTSRLRSVASVAASVPITLFGLVLVTSVAPEGSLAKPGESVPVQVDEQLAGDLEDA